MPIPTVTKVDLEDKLKSGGYTLIGRATINEVSIMINLDKQFVNRIPTSLLDICDIRFVHDYYVPKESKLTKNEVYVYVKPNTSLFFD